MCSFAVLHKQSDKNLEKTDTSFLHNCAFFGIQWSFSSSLIAHKNVLQQTTIFIILIYNLQQKQTYRSSTPSLLAQRKTLASQIPRWFLCPKQSYFFKKTFCMLRALHGLRHEEGPKSPNFRTNMHGGYEKPSRTEALGPKSCRLDARCPTNDAWKGNFHYPTHRHLSQAWSP